MSENSRQAYGLKKDAATQQSSKDLTKEDIQERSLTPIMLRFTVSKNKEEGTPETQRLTASEAPDSKTLLTKALGTRANSTLREVAPMKQREPILDNYNRCFQEEMATAPLKNLDEYVVPFTKGGGGHDISKQSYSTTQRQLPLIFDRKQSHSIMSKREKTSRTFDLNGFEEFSSHHVKIVQEHKANRSVTINNLYNI